MPIVQQRRGTAASLQTVTLSAGQIAYETDTGKVKVGDGTTVYSSLEYITDASNIADGSIATNHIADGAINNSKLANTSVSLEKMQNDSVTTNALQPASVTHEKLAQNSVDRTNIIDGEVIGAKLANNAVLTPQIYDAAVTTAKIADDAVTFAKMQDVNANTLLGAVNAGAVTQITCGQVGRNILAGSTAADVRTTIGAVDQGTVNTSITNAVAGTANIADDAVTYSKMQDTTNGGCVLGRTGNYGVSAGGEIQEIALSDYARTYINQTSKAGVKNVLGFVEQAEIDTAITNLVGTAPVVLDTLGEIATALNNDQNLASTLSTSIGTNTASAATNAANVATNTGNINTNIGNIAANAANISTNITDIAAKMPLAGGTFTGSTLHSGPAIDGASAIGNRIIGGGSKTIYDDPSGVNRAKIREVERASNFSVRVGSVSNTDPTNSRVNYLSPHDDVHYNWNGSAWVTVPAYAGNWIGHYDVDPLIRWTSVSSNETGEETEFGKIQLYDGGTSIAGMGVSPSNFNIGTKGGINFSIYTNGALRTRYSSNGNVDHSAGTHTFAGDVTSSTTVSAVSFLAGNGSSTAASYGFTGDTNTGMFWNGSTGLNLVWNGSGIQVASAHINAEKRILVPTGTQAAPSIAQAGNDDTGISFGSVGANQINLNVAGGAKVSINPTATYLAGLVQFNGTITDGTTTKTAAELMAAISPAGGSVQVNGYGTAIDPAFEIEHTVDGTGFYSPSSTVNGGNSAGYGFAISAAHNHVAEFGYKSHIGNGRPTIYGGAAAALLELNGNSRRGSLFGYNTYATSASNANAAIGGEFLCIAQGGTSANSPKGFKAKLQSQSANGSSAVGGHFELSLESVTGSWGNAYGVHCELGIASSCTGTLTGTAAALFIDAVGKTSNATYTQTDGVDRVYAIFQTGNSDNNRFDGTSWFRNNVHIVDNGDLDISTGVGQIILSNGSANDPAICFGADTNTGIKRNTNGNLDFVTNATNRLSITTAGDIHTSSAGTVFLNNHVTIGNTLTVTNGMNVSELAQSGASTGQTIQWDGSAWVPATVSGGGGGATTVGGLSDVTVSSVADNNLLRYDSANSRWENYSPDGFSSASGGNTAINLADGNKIHKWTCASSGVQAVILLNVPSGSGVSCSFTLVIEYPGSGTTTAIVQWPSSFKWPGGVAPTLTNTGGKQDTFTFLSLDNGGSWLAHVGGQNF